MFRTISALAILFAFAILAGCTDDPGTTDNNGGNGCEDECALGDRSCIDESTVQFCVPDSNTGCNRIIDTTCLTSEQCVQGTCDELPRDCEDVCTDLDTRCTVDGEVETCADHDGNGCVEFGNPVSCDAGEFCEPRDGLCRASECSDECTQSETSCEGDLISTCGINAQGCLVYGPAKECGDGQTCQGGECVGGAGCEDECNAGESVCTGDGNLRTCGDFDADSCSELGDPMPCPGNDVCEEGQCVAPRNCSDACIAGEKVCVGNQVSECVTGGSGCLEFSNPMACSGANESCTVEAGTVACRAAAVSGPVVINEIFYDALGDDVRGNEGSPTFIELRGPAGLDISAYVLEMVNGSSSGGTYNSVTLPAGARLDGNGFAVVTLDNPDTYLGLAAGFYTNVYDAMTPYSSGQDGMQNGPDNVRLLDDVGVELDAVGYGTFGASNTFAGEGTSVPDPVPGRSVGRINGVDTDNNSADFVSFYPTPGLENADLIINEVYVNQPGVDDGSETFVELVAPITGWEDADLSGYVLRAINGFDGTDYIFSGALDGIIMEFIGFPAMLNDDQDGYVVICDADVASDALFQVCSVDFDGVDFQNGPDNFVLEYLGRPIDAIGYGSFGAGETFVGEGSAAPYTSSDSGKALARWPLADPTRDNDTDDNSVDFRRVSPTPGRSNPR